MIYMTLLFFHNECHFLFQPAAAAGAAVPLETPSVAAARAHHFQALAHEYAINGPDLYYGHGGYGHGYYGH